MKGLVYRARWGAMPPSCSTRLDRSKVQGIAVHYTGMNADEQSDHARCAARVRGIQRFHMQERGWCDIAYSFVVCRHGAIYAGRGWYRRTAANGTNKANSEYLAVCFLGDDTKGRADVTAEAKAAFQRVFARFKVWYGKPPVLKPHSAFTGTACPGDELRAWLRRIGT